MLQIDLQKFFNNDVFQMVSQIELAHVRHHCSQRDLANWDPNLRENRWKQ